MQPTTEPARAPDSGRKALPVHTDVGGADVLPAPTGLPPTLLARLLALSETSEY